jgi:hypothetical protein
MATGVQSAWSTTPDDNDDADSGINLRENQAPSTYNDAVRAAMARVKAWAKDWQGGLVTGGTSTAYTLTTNEGITLADGVTVTARMSATSGATPTLDVDGTGAVAIQVLQGTAVPTGALKQGGIYTFVYYASSAAWIVRAGLAPGVLDAPSGTKMIFCNSTAPAGWTKDTSLDNAAIRLVSGSVGADAGSANFTDAFASRTILAANLPSMNLSHNLNTESTLVDASATVNPATNGAAPGGSNVLNTGTTVTINKTQATRAVSGTIALGGSGTAMSFAVKYADAIRAVRD